MGQAKVMRVLVNARLLGDGWLTVSDIAESLEGVDSLSERTVYKVVRRMLSSEFLEFRFMGAKKREVRIKARYMPENRVSGISGEKEFSYNTVNTCTNRDFFGAQEGE